MEKTLKTIILSTITAGALALSAGCIALPVPVKHHHRHPIVIYQPPHPAYHHRYPNYQQNRPFNNPTGNHYYRH